jgi:hypothetical protein
MRFSNFLNKALKGKRIMHSARALFLTFLALEKSKRNSTFHENCATAELSEGRKKISSGAGGGKRFAAEKLCRSSATAAELNKICSGTEFCRSSASRKVGTRSAAERGAGILPQQ